MNIVDEAEITEANDSAKLLNAANPGVTGRQSSPENRWKSQCQESRSCGGSTQEQSIDQERHQ